MKLKKTLTQVQLQKRIKNLHKNFDRTTVREVVAILNVMATRAENDAKMECNSLRSLEFALYKSHGSEFLSQIAYELDPGYERNFK